MHGGGGLIPGGLDPTRKPEGAKAIVRDRLERAGRHGRMGRRERRIFIAVAVIATLGIVARLVLSAV